MLKIRRFYIRSSLLGLCLISFYSLNSCRKNKEPAACLMSVPTTAPKSSVAFHIKDDETILAQGFLKYPKNADGEYFKRDYLSASDRAGLEKYLSDPLNLVHQIMPVTFAIAKVTDPNPPHQVRYQVRIFDQVVEVNSFEGLKYELLVSLPISGLTKDTTPSLAQALEHFTKAASLPGSIKTVTREGVTSEVLEVQEDGKKNTYIRAANKYFILSQSYQTVNLTNLILTRREQFAMDVGKNNFDGEASLWAFDSGGLYGSWDSGFSATFNQNDRDSVPHETRTTGWCGTVFMHQKEPAYTISTSSRLGPHCSAFFLGDSRDFEVIADPDPSHIEKYHAIEAVIEALKINPFKDIRAGEIASPASKVQSINESIEKKLIKNQLYLDFIAQLDDLKRLAQHFELRDACLKVKDDWYGALETYCPHQTKVEEYVLKRLFFYDFNGTLKSASEMAEELVAEFDALNYPDGPWAKELVRIKAEHLPYLRGFKNLVKPDLISPKKFLVGDMSEPKWLPDLHKEVLASYHAAFLKVIDDRSNNPLFVTPVPPESDPDEIWIATFPSLFFKIIYPRYVALIRAAMDNYLALGKEIDALSKQGIRIPIHLETAWLNKTFKIRNIPFDDAFIGVYRFPLNLDYEKDKDLFSKLYPRTFAALTPKLKPISPLDEIMLVNRTNGIIITKDKNGREAAKLLTQFKSKTGAGDLNGFFNFHWKYQRTSTIMIDGRYVLNMPFANPVAGEEENGGSIGIPQAYVNPEEVAYPTGVAQPTVAGGQNGGTTPGTVSTNSTGGGTNTPGNTTTGQTNASTAGSVAGSTQPSSQPSGGSNSTGSTAGDEQPSQASCR